MSIIIITFALGVIIAAMGLKIWKNEQIEMIHAHFHRNVTDVKEYTAAFGKTLVFMGIVIVCSGILGLLSFVPAWLSSLILYAGIIASIVMVLMVQHRYNGTFISK